MESSQYSQDPYTRSFGAGRIAKLLAARHGQRYLDYRQAWARAEDHELPPFPLNLVFDLINACTLRCPQCLRSAEFSEEFGGFFNKKDARLTLASVIQALDEGKCFSLPSVNIGGSGECMLHPDFVKICAAVMEHGILELRVISNGTLLTPSIAEALVDMQAHMLSISIDAFSAHTYGLVRGNEAKYQEVFDNVLRFLEIRKTKGSLFPLLRITFVKQPDNADELPAFVEHWSKLADMIDVQAYHTWRPSEFTADFDCTDPWKRLTLYSDGRISPCCGFTGLDYIVGQFPGESLKSVWDGKKMAAIRRMVTERKYAMPCLRCHGTAEPVGQE